MPRIEIVADRRRAHGAAFRAGVVAECAAPGARVQDVAARYGICPSLIYRWRRAIGVSTVGEPVVRLFPVRIASAEETPALTPAPIGPSSHASTATTRRAGSIEIELAGDVKVRVDESVSLAALRRVMSVLRG